MCFPTYTTLTISLQMYQKASQIVFHFGTSSRPLLSAKNHAEHSFNLSNTPAQWLINKAYEAVVTPYSQEEAIAEMVHPLESGKLKRKK